ncbi:MAG TPA: VOC family protein [Nitrososphaera sp.]|nr:VOC family protein [Nitrososphaera sp.]
MSIGYVSLNVPDLQRSLDLYRSVLAFRTVGRTSSQRARLSCPADDDESRPQLIELLQAESKNINHDAVPKRAGLYHFAVLLQERSF